MKVFITGGTGFIGRNIAERLLERGHSVVVLSRSGAKGKRVLGAGVEIIEGDPAKEGSWQKAAGECDAIINLCGEPILAKKWTPARKQVILDSRLLPTKRVVEAVGSAPRKPTVFLSGSAIGYYSDRGGDTVTEADGPGRGFGADLNVKWEAEANKAAALGVRVVNLRTGFVLGTSGGGLQRMAAPYKFFAGGRLGSGLQYVSWIHLDDYVALIMFALETDSISGPLNLTAPEPVTNRDFSKALGQALGRPAWLPTPAFVFRLMFGEGAALLVEGQKVLPKKALDAGFKFKFETIENALKNLYGSGKARAV